MISETTEQTGELQDQFMFENLEGTGELLDQNIKSETPEKIGELRDKKVMSQTPEGCGGLQDQIIMSKNPEPTSEMQQSNKYFWMMLGSVVFETCSKETNFISDVSRFKEFVLDYIILVNATMKSNRWTNVNMRLLRKTKLSINYSSFILRFVQVYLEMMIF